MTALADAVRLALRDAADPAKAPAMQAYMKSSMPFLGVSRSPARTVGRTAFAAHPLSSSDAWRTAVLELWRSATHREERYAAIDLSGYALYRDYQDLGTVPMYEEMIVDGAWWDYVDELAIHRVGPLLGSFPAEMRPLMLEWSRSADLWKRRTSILCQNRFKDATDLSLLYACIEPSLSDTEFFARKAIGWALREYAKSDPAEVERYVSDHATELSGLSRREALKHLQSPA